MTSFAGFSMFANGMPRTDVPERCVSSRASYEDHLDPEDDDLEPLITENFEKIKDWTETYQNENPDSSLKEIDGLISQELYKMLEKEDVFPQLEKVIAEAVMLTGRRSLMMATEKIWRPFFEELKPQTQTVLGIQLRTFSENLTYLRHLAQSDDPLTKEQMTVYLTETLDFAIRNQQFDSLLLQESRIQFIHLLGKVDLTCFVKVLLSKIDVLVQQIHANPSIKKDFEAFLSIVGILLFHADKTHLHEGTLTLLLGACQMGFFLSDQQIVSYLGSQLTLKFNEYTSRYSKEETSIDEQAKARDFSRLVALTLVLRFTTHELSDPQKFDDALSDLCQQAILLDPKALNEICIPKLINAFEYDPQQFKFFFDELAQRLANSSCNLNQWIFLLEDVYLPMMSRVSLMANYQFDSFNLILLGALDAIERGNKKALNPDADAKYRVADESLTLIKLVKICLRVLERKYFGANNKSYDEKIKKIDDRQLGLARHVLINIFDVVHKMGETKPSEELVDPKFTTAYENNFFATLYKVASSGIPFRCDAVTAFLKKITPSMPVDTHYDKITDGKACEFPITRNPSIIWYLNEFLTYSSCKLTDESPQVFADRVFYINNVKAVLKADWRVFYDYLKLFSTLKKSNPALTISANAALEILSTSFEVLKSPASPNFLAYADMLESGVLSHLNDFPEVSDEAENIDPKKVGEVTKKKNVAFGEFPLEYRACTALEKWLKASKTRLSTQIKIRVKTFADFLITNCPKNVNMLACADSIFPHYPDLALTIIRLGMQNPSGPAQKFNVFLKNIIKFVKSSPNLVVKKCVQDSFEKLICEWPKHLDVYAHAESILSDFPEVAIELIEKQGKTTNFYPSIALLMNETVQSCFSEEELPALFEKSLKKRLEEYCPKALDEFKAHAFRTGLKLADWKSFIQTTLMRSGMKERQIRFVNAVQEALNEMDS